MSLRKLVPLAAMAALLLAVPAARAVTTLVTFDTITAGTLLSTQRELAVLGLTFADGAVVVRCADVPGCSVARSGANAAVALAETEFRRRPLVVEFTSAQQVVSLYVKSELVFSPAREIMASLNAYDAAGLPVANATARFRSDAAWQRLSVGSSFLTARIRRVVLFGGQTDTAPTNFLVVDDLTFEGDHPPPPPADTSPPAVSILSPASGVTINHSFVDLRVEATDDSQLQRVDGRVVHDSTGTLAEPFELCGISTLCPARSVVGTRTVDLPDLEGAYTIIAEACDAAGNCASTSRRFVLDLTEPPPPVPVRPFRVELNQAVQNQLFNVPAPGDVETAISSVPLVPGKDTVVRYYVLGQGGARPGYTARLSLFVRRADGSTFGRVVGPNVGMSSITVPPDPVDTVARRNLLLQMRADPAQTLNYVIPGSLLADARFLELKLQEGSTVITGGVQVTLHSPVRLGLNIVKAFGPGAPGTVPSDATIDANILRYLEKAYPVTEVRVLSRRSYVIMTGSIWEAFMSDCDDVWYQIWWAYGGDDAPVRFATADPNITETLGVVPVGSFSDASGCAHIGDPDDDDDRIGATAIAMPWGDVAAQEIAHGMGLIHTSNFHREADGGDAEPWPYQHGMIGPFNFGAIPRVSVTPGAFDLGQWFVSLVDPCPTFDLAQREPACTLPDNQLTHDFMSYGASTAPPGSTLVTAFGNWVSDITYSRIYHAIRDRIAPAAYGSASASARASLQGEHEDERVEALLVDGVIREDGGGNFLPILRKRLPPSFLEQEPGSYTLELRDGVGNLLLARSFEPQPATAHTSHRNFIRQAVPLVDGVERVIVRKGERTIIDESASRHAPAVRVLSPDGGEILTSGIHEVRWEAADEDRDPLTFLVQYSPDSGRSWQGIGMSRSGLPLALNMNVGELIPGHKAIVRVVASDGINVAVDESTCAFSLGTEREPECDVDIDIKPGEEPNPVNPSSRGSVPVAILSRDGFDAPTRVERRTLTFGRTGDEASLARCAADAEDVNADGRLDLVCNFRTELTSFSAGDSVGVLLGRTLDGIAIVGTDSIRIVP